MIVDIILAWLLITTQAPTWIMILFSISVFIKVLTTGIELGKK